MGLTDEQSTTASTPPIVLETRDDSVAIITLNRPDRLNAWTPELGRLYLDRIEACGSDPSVRAIVVTGAGRGFCAGADMAHLDSVSGSTGDPTQDDRGQLFPRTVPKPIIAAINGPCAGIGLVIALACDLRFAVAGAKITTAFARRGLVAEHGASWLLSRLVGPSGALDLLLSARVILADEAHSLGLVDRVVDEGGATVLESAVEYAKELATYSSPTSMAVIKRQVLADLERGPLDAYLEAERLMEESLQGPDLAEGVASFQERRPPRFPPLDRGRLPTVDGR